jgi:hypothetical protein
MFSPVTGSLGGAERAAAIAAANSQGLPAPLRPTKELYQEKSLNLTGVTHNQALQCTCDSVVLSWWSRFSPVVLMQHVPATHVRGNQGLVLGWFCLKQLLQLVRMRGVAAWLCLL